jgi:hypothetical protein
VQRACFGQSILMKSQLGTVAFSFLANVTPETGFR